MERDSLNFFVRFYAFFSFFISFAHSLCLEGQIDINTASLSDLKTLKGIGDVKAQAIINARPFSSIDDLLRVKGIGPATLGSIKDKICIFEESQKENVTSPKKGQQPPINSITEINSYQNPSQSTRQEISNQNKLQEEKNSYPLRININTAAFEELQKIIGVGEKTAKEIIASRPLCSLDDLSRIKGIGPKNLEKIKSQGIAFVEENFCMQEETIIAESKKPSESEENSTIKKESIINLNSQEKEDKEKLLTGKIIYESKTEKIRKYAIYFFAAMLVFILFLILKD